MSIHKRIKERRQALNMSMQALATACGYKSWQTVQQWEREDSEGGTAPKRTKLNLAAKALGTTAEWLTTGVEAGVESAKFNELSGSEAQLVMLYRQLQNDDVKRELLEIAHRMSQPQFIRASARIFAEIGE